MPVVTVKVSSFLKHPAAGHTLYECRVELPHTRQVKNRVYIQECSVWGAQQQCSLYL